MHEESLDMGNMEELDDAAASFEMKPAVAKETGCWAYVSTRNNNFSNRSQKGILCVGTGDFQEDVAGSTGRTIDAGSGFVEFANGALNQNVGMKIQTWHDKDKGSYMMKVEPIDMQGMLNDDKDMKIGIPFSLSSFMKPVMYHKVDPDEEWKACDAEYNVVEGEYVAEHMAHEGGWYEVQQEVDVGSVIALVLGCIAVFAVIGYICYRKNMKESAGYDSDAEEVEVGKRQPNGNW